MFLIHFGPRSTSIQMGLKYHIEGYIKDLKIIILGIDLEVRVYRSQCKRKKPHVKVVTIADEKINTVHGPQSKIKLIYI